MVETFTRMICEVLAAFEGRSSRQPPRVESSHIWSGQQQVDPAKRSMIDDASHGPS
jgi:hypothetical protein